MQKQEVVFMATLACNAKNCAYNEESKCCKGDIMVGGKNACACDETCCESFRDEGTEHFSSALNHPCQTISIDCEATNCVHNTNYKCHAENVKIEGTKASKYKDTACGTFKER
jgi:hypothetical protein